MLLCCHALADGGLIRDAETEKFLRDLSNPIFKAANLDVKNIKIYIVNDESINAFVSGGQNVFINTGLITKYQTPDALIGVIAHETGHIAAGHIARSSEEIKNAENGMFLSYLLGIGAILGGVPQAGEALILGGSNISEKLFMKYTRGQEEAADQHAINYLDKMSYPANGLVTLLEYFESQMIGLKNQIDEYALSHPVSKKRINLIKDRTKDKNFSDKAINEKLQKSMTRVIAKLDAFILSPDFTLKKYQNRSDETANYAKSIAYFRKGETEKSLKLLDKIISDNSRDGFLLELKGQILFESGKVHDSIITYHKAIKLLTKEDAAQSKIAFATAILAMKKHDDDLINLAIKTLKDCQKYEMENPFLYKQLGLAYSKLGDEGRSYLALAEYNYTQGNKKKTENFAKKAKEKLPKIAKEELLRADDLLELAKKLKDDEKE